MVKMDVTISSLSISGIPTEPMVPPPSLTRQVTRLKDGEEEQKYIYVLSYCAGVTNTKGGTGGKNSCSK